MSQSADLVFLELSAGDARNAKIAINKTNRDRYGRGEEGYSDDAVERVAGELDRGFDEDDRNATLRLEFRADDAKLIPSAVAAHARDRKDKGHLGAAPKYRSTADKIRHQLTLQGVMTQ